MAEGFESSGDYRQDTTNLEELADEKAAFQRDKSTELEHLAALWVVGENNDDRKGHFGAKQSIFTRSNNVQSKSSLEDLMCIYKSSMTMGQLPFKAK